MNIENANYLKDRLLYMGFGEKLNNDLEKNIKSGKDKFEIPFTAEFNKGESKQVVEYNLSFAKSKQEDMFFFNNYKATLKDENPEKDKAQTFYVNKSNNVTAKEAYNLLDGRAVHKKLETKEGEPYEAWLQLDSKKLENGNHSFMKYHSAYGFDLEKNVSKIPMKELESPEQKVTLLKSLERGNLHSVTLNLAGKEEKAFLEANPKDRNIIIYDANMINQTQGTRESKSESQGKSESPRQEQKTEPEPAEKKGRQRKHSVH